MMELRACGVLLALWSHLPSTVSLPIRPPTSQSVPAAFGRTVVGGVERLCPVLPQPRLPTLLEATKTKEPPGISPARQIVEKPNFLKRRSSEGPNILFFPEKENLPNLNKDEPLSDERFEQLAKLLESSANEDNNDLVNDPESQTTETETSDVQDEEETETNKKSAMATAALFRRNSRDPRSDSSSSRKGARSKKRSVIGAITATLTDVASAATAAEKPLTQSSVNETITANNDNDDPAKKGRNQQEPRKESISEVLQAKTNGKTVIQGTIDSLIEGRARQNKNQDLGEQKMSIGLLGKRVAAKTSPLPLPGSVLIHPSYPPFSSSPSPPLRDRLAVRVATVQDDEQIAELRLSVFSDFTSDVRRKYLSKSCEVLQRRRDLGAVCLVATVNERRPVPCVETELGSEWLAETNSEELINEAHDSDQWIVGSVECSVHEFQGTELGRRRPIGSLLYITEVAVSPHARRCGAATKLMRAVDRLAFLNNVETLFLHVDVANEAAMRLYRKAGFKLAKNIRPTSSSLSHGRSNDPSYAAASYANMFDEFTKSLNLHDGATRGRNHYLLFKDLTNSPTWLSDKAHHVNDHSEGKLGFDVLL